MKKKIIVSSIVIVFALAAMYMIFGTNFLDLPEYEVWRQTISLDGDIEEGDMYFNIEDNHVYANIDWIQNHSVADISWDHKNEVLTYYDGRNLYRFYKDGTAKKNQETIEFNQPIVKKSGQDIFISTQFLETKELYMFEYQKDLNRLIVYETSNIDNVKRATKNMRVRSSNSYMSEAIDVIAENEIYKVITDGEWKEVVSARGKKGYVNENALDTKGFFKYMRRIGKLDVPIGIENIRVAEVETPYENDKRDSLINMTWNHFVSKTPKSTQLKAQPGIDVVSPTWFSLRENLSIRDIGTMDYMNWAKKNKYEVWILFANGFDPKRTSDLVNDSLKREKVIEEVVKKTLNYGAEGINIDFENVYYKDSKMLTQFVKELYARAKAKGLVLSMDVTFISESENWSKCYDRKELHKYLDYMVIMAYDEYWAGRKEAGPVASIPWVENGVEKFLQEVPSEKIILGAPFYSRLWKENQKTGEITSVAYTMKKVEEFVKKNKVDVVFDEKNKLNYARLEYKGVLYQLWIEDFKSINQRIEIIKNRNLKGFASWRKGFEKQEVWSYINQKLKTSDK